jgi:hypothetical protein
MKIFACLFTLLLTAGTAVELFSLEDYSYQNPAEAAFSHVGDVPTIINALEDRNPDIVYCAIKRAGQLNLECARERIKLILIQANPSLNRNNALKNASLRPVYYEGILVLGKIGNADDSSFLSSFLYSSDNVEELFYLLKSITALPDSQVTVARLHDFVLSLNYNPDSRITRAIVDTIIFYHTRAFINTLISLEGKVKGEIKDYVAEAMREICKCN